MAVLNIRDYTVLNIQTKDYNIHNLISDAYNQWYLYCLTKFN